MIEVENLFFNCLNDMGCKIFILSNSCEVSGSLTYGVKNAKILIKAAGGILMSVKTIIFP